MLQSISDKEVKKIIWVHNLSFEFQFLLNIIDDFVVFAREPRRLIKAYSPKYNIEFRCSYVLSNVGLAKLADTYKLPVKKLVGELDYNILRTPLTIMQTNELAYQENDCLVVYYFIKMLIDEYEHVEKIPLTQTGRVRREVKELFKGDKKYYEKIISMYPDNFDTYAFLIKTFAGGYTHANFLNSNMILENVGSFDIASSYPAVMAMMKFPMSKFVKADPKLLKLESIDFNRRACLINITFYDLKAKNSNHYISSSKCLDVQGFILDNGRIMEAKQLSINLTEVDFEIITKVYEYSSYDVNELYTAIKDYLPAKYIDYMLNLYSQKTALKGIDEEAIMYARIKEYINSLYGMCVTNTIRDEVLFDEFEWKVQPLTEDDVTGRIRNDLDHYKIFLNYAWGVWVTAYARQRLWDMIIELDEDVVYCDTDSIKFIDLDNVKKFERYNNEWTKKLKNRGIDYDLLAPFDKNGERHPIGLFEQEKTADKFITLGAKKYCVQYGDKIKITVSGVPKKKGSEAIKNIEDFKVGYVFDYDCNKLELYYNDTQEEMTVTDCQGNTYKCSDRYGVTLKPTTYKLGISTDYEMLLEYLNSQTSTHIACVKGEYPEYFVRAMITTAVEKGYYNE